MFITNSFDSLFASLGVSIGGFQKNVDPLTLGMSILGGALTMGIFSSFIAVYLSERTERLNDLKKLEKEIMVSLKDSIYGRSINILAFYISLWSGVGSILFASLVSLPYFVFVILNIKVTLAFFVSIAIAFFELAYLGYYMSKVSNEKVLINIIKNLALGVCAILLILTIKLFIIK